MKKQLVLAFTCLVSASVALPQGDPAAMDKWLKPKTIFYHVDGAFAGKALISDPNGGAWADVTDRVAFDLEWDLRNGTLAHVLKIENFATKAVNLRQGEPKCAAPVLRGEYEHWTVQEIATGPTGQPEMKVETTIPDVDVPQFCTGKPKRWKGRKKVEPVELVVLSPVLLTMPLGDSKDVKLSSDRKSLVTTKNGWTWTFTPSLTKPAV
jgi:hypothetical protein